MQFSFRIFLKNHLVLETQRELCTSLSSQFCNGTHSSSFFVLLLVIFGVCDFDFWSENCWASTILPSCPVYSKIIFVFSFAPYKLTLIFYIFPAFKIDSFGLGVLIFRTFFYGLAVLTWEVRMGPCTSVACLTLL